MKLLEQHEIISLIEMDTEIGNENNRLIHSFVVKQNINKKWEVEFSCSSPQHISYQCKLRARRSEVRKFSRLNGVEKFMETIGVKEFTVML